MSSDKLTRIAIVNPDKCQPRKCHHECRKSCPVNRMGKVRALWWMGRIGAGTSTCCTHQHQQAQAPANRKPRTAHAAPSTANRHHHHHYQNGCEVVACLRTVRLVTPSISYATTAHCPIASDRRPSHPPSLSHPRPLHTHMSLLPHPESPTGDGRPCVPNSHLFSFAC